MTGNEVDKIIQEATSVQDAICQITAIVANEMEEAGVPMDWLKNKNGAKAFVDAAMAFIMAGESFLKKKVLDKANAKTGEKE